MNLKIDNEIKLKLLKLDALPTIAHCKNRLNHIMHKSMSLQHYSENQIATIIKDYEYSRMILDNMSNDELRVSSNMIRARQKRSARVRQYIEKLLYIANHKQVYFATLTFNDDAMKRLNKDVRRKYVIRFLKSLNPYYIANIDYGKKHEREHYHCLIPIKSAFIQVYNEKKRIYHLIDSKKWLYGFETFKLMHRTEEDKTRVSIYIDKFVNHTIKDTTKNERIIYSDALKKAIAIDKKN